MAVVTSFVVEQSPLVAGAAGTGRVAARLRGASSLLDQPVWVAAAPMVLRTGSPPGSPTRGARDASTPSSR